MSISLRGSMGRAMYALVLCVLAFSTLEQFAEINRDLLGLSAPVFHSVAFALAFAAALFEAISLRGLDGLRSLWERPDPLSGIVNRRCMYRAALTEDLPKVRKLALKRYGWAFPLDALQRWHHSNPQCLFVMISEGELVGYVDAFPISNGDYEFLLGGGDEKLITPLTDEAVTEDCSFYIASVVILTEWGGRLPVLLKRATTFFSRCYARKVWRRICAIGYSAEGRRLLETKQMQRARTGGPEVRMYTIDRASLDRLSKINRAFWRKLLADLPGDVPLTSTAATSR